MQVQEAALYEWMLNMEILSELVNTNDLYRVFFLQDSGHF